MPLSAWNHININWPFGTRAHDDIVAEDDVIMRSCSGTNASYNKM